MVRNIITDLCHHLEIGIDGNLDIGNKRVIVGTPTITLTNNILTISCDTVGASIYYTLDGSTPTSSSTKYTTAVILNNSCTIKAIAIKGNKSSIVVSQNYIAILTAWKIVGNSEVHGQEIWSCGEYNPIDGKWHILVQPQGGSIADIALTEPLRKYNDTADTIEFPSDTEGKALVTRPLGSTDMGTLNFKSVTTAVENIYRIATAALKNVIAKVSSSNVKGNIICAIYDTVTANNTYNTNKVGIAVNDGGTLSIYDDNYNQSTDTEAFLEHINGVELIYELVTPTTELVDAPQIEEAESYTCVISQGGKAVEWSSFTPNPD